MFRQHARSISDKLIPLFLDHDPKCVTDVAEHISMRIGREVGFEVLADMIRAKLEVLEKHL
jgi:hypothetical protein